MKNEEMLKLIGEIDDKLIDEASPMNKENVKKNDHQRKIKRISLMAACIACLVVLASLWLFVPFNTDPPSVEQYKNSEYYDLIYKINELTYEKPRYKNNFQKLMSVLIPVKKNDADNSGPGGPASVGSYEEVTDNQVEGVIEADLFKRSDEYIYYMKNNMLEIYSIAAEDSERVGSFDLHQDMVEILQYVKADSINVKGKGIYLSSDCKTLTVLAMNGYGDSTVTMAITYNVTDPQNVRRIKYAFVSGEYQSSRMINDELIILTRRYVYDEANFSNDMTYLPYTYGSKGYDFFTPNEIISAQNPGYPGYTVICKLSGRSLEVLDRIAYFSYVSDEYITKENVYVTFEYLDEDQERSIVTREHKGTVTVNGSILDQYSMDEYEGVFRVVTTTWYIKYKELLSNRTETISWVSSADLYCIDTTTFDIISSVKSFAPQRESVRSVRFDKTAAYVCTSVQLLDPVFFFDLSDVNNITYTDTGTIPGFSTSLINMGDGYLLGIGVGETSSEVKIEVYKQGDGKVDSVCSYVVKDAYYSTDYKSYFINREKGLVGLAVIGYGNLRYLLLKFEDENLLPLINDNIESWGDIYSVRATLIDGYFYVLSDRGLTVKKLPEEYIK